MLIDRAGVVAVVLVIFVLALKLAAVAVAAINAGVWGGADSGGINLNFNLILNKFKIKTQKHLSK